MARPHQLWQRRLFPHSGAKPFHRMGSAVPRWLAHKPHPRHVSRAQQRLRRAYCRMKNFFATAAVFVTLELASPAHAHRTTGLLQASLVDVLPSQIEVEITLVPGIDIAPKIAALLDTNGD